MNRNLLVSKDRILPFFAAEIKKAARIARYLLGNGIDIISAESLMLMHSPEVNFLAGFLRSIMDRLMLFC